MHGIVAEEEAVKENELEDDTSGDSIDEQGVSRREITWIMGRQI